MKPRLIELFKEYDACHQHKTNRLTHEIAIPLIFFNLLVMLDWISIFTINVEFVNYRISVGMLVMVLFTFWYILMSLKLGLMLLPMMIALLAIGTFTPSWLVITFGIAGWVIQLMGHLVWEKNSPNFVTNLIQFLVGPIFFLALVTGDWQTGKYLITEQTVSA
jgi:uncharacterized membrane protein YGL010W